MGELVELDVTTVEESVTVNVTEEGQVDIAVFAEKGDTGPAGPAGPNSVTSATTSDGTANLSLSNVTTATATVTGTLNASHIHGNIAGSVYAHVRAGENLAKGDPVYISGSHGSGASLIAIVSKADASNASKMPAVGVMDAAVSNNANGHMVITGTISDIDTNAYAVNSVLYVASGGGFTTTPPNDNSQPVAIVERSNTNNGAVIVKVNGLATSNGYANPQKLLRTDATGQLTIGNLSIATGSTLAYVSVMNETYPDNTASLVVNGLGVSELYLGTSATAGGSVLAQNLTDFRTYQLPNASGTLALTSDLPTLGTNVATFLATPTSANLAAAVTDETGSGSLVFATSPTLTSPTLTGTTINTSLTLNATTYNYGAGAKSALQQSIGVCQRTYMTSDFSLPNAGTDTAMDVSLDANSVYLIKIVYSVSGTSASSFGTINGANGLTISHQNLFFIRDSNSNSNIISTALYPSLASFGLFPAITNNRITATIEGIIYTVNAGVIRFSTGAPVAATLTRQKGSYYEITKLS